MPANNLARTLTLLREIPTHPRKATATELADKLKQSGFSVTKRSVERDLRWLAESDVVILDCDERSKPFGWCYAKNFRGFDFPSMSPSSAIAVKLMTMYMSDILPPPTQRLLKEHVARANAVLERTNEDYLRLWPKKIRVLPRGFVHTPPSYDPKIIDVVYTAVLTGRQFHALYTKIDGEFKERNINVYGIVVRPPLTYLVATYHAEQAPFVLALHRLSKAKLLVDDILPIRNFDLDEYIAAGELNIALGGCDTRLVIHADSKIGPRLKETPLGQNQNITLLNNGLYAVAATVRDTLDLRNYLLGLGRQIEVIEPESIRIFMVDQARMLSTMYLGSP